MEWDPEAPLTPIGQASFFIEFLKASGVFDALVADCPGEVYEYAALVTSLDAKILTLGQLYRDRADCENTSMN